MAIKNFPNVSPDADSTFGLESNNSEFISELNNNVQHMAMSGARWRGSVVFSNRTRNDANKVKAFKASLGGKSGRFYLTPFDAYQVGTMSGDGVVDGAVPSGASEIQTKSWDADQAELFAAGDYIEVNGELKLVTDTVAVGQDYIEYDAVNYMPSPFDPSEWDSDSDGDIVNEVVVNPSGESFVGLATQQTTGGFVLNATGDTSLTIGAGDKFYGSILIKSLSGNNGVRLRLEFDDIFFGAFSFNCSNGQLIQAEGDASASAIKVTEIDGFFLCEFYFTSGGNYTEFNMQAFMCDESTPTSVPPIGSQSYAQAAFFGKADDWPAKLRANATIPIAPPLRRALTGGETITTNEPKGVFYLGSDDQDWNINVNGLHTMGFDFIEDVN